MELYLTNSFESCNCAVNTVSYKVYYGVRAGSGLPTQSQIEAGTLINMTSYPQDVVADFTDIDVASNYFIAIESTAPVRTKWYCTDLNKGNIAAAPEAVSFGGLVGVYNVYLNNFLTDFSTPLRLRN